MIVNNGAERYVRVFMDEFISTLAAICEPITWLPGSFFTKILRVVSALKLTSKQTSKLCIAVPLHRKSTDIARWNSYTKNQ